MKIIIFVIIVILTIMMLFLSPNNNLMFQEFRYFFSPTQYLGVSVKATEVTSIQIDDGIITDINDAKIIKNIMDYLSTIKLTSIREWDTNSNCSAYCSIYLFCGKELKESIYLYDGPYLEINNIKYRIKSDKVVETLLKKAK